MSRFLEELKGKLVFLYGRNGEEIFGYLKDYDEDYLLIEKPVYNAYIWNVNPADMMDKIINQKIKPELISKPVPINMAPIVENKESQIFNKSALFPKSNYIISLVVKDSDKLESVKENYDMLVKFMEEFYNEERLLNENNVNLENLIQNVDKVAPSDEDKIN